MIAVWDQPRDYATAVGFSQLIGNSRVAALGNNPDIDTAPEDIWSGGGQYPWMTAATPLEILSTDANDTSAGTGARTVTIVGLDINYGIVTQSVILNGITPVAIPMPLFRINSAMITSAGTGRVNAGDINIRDVSGATVRCVIPLGYGISRQSQYTVPAGSTLAVQSLLFCINRPTTTRDATIATFFQSPLGFYRLSLEVSVDGNPYRHDGTPGIIVPEKFDFGLRCTYVSSTNTDITGAWLGILKTNEAL